MRSGMHHRETGVRRFIAADFGAFEQLIALTSAMSGHHRHHYGGGASGNPGIPRVVGPLI